MNDIVFRIVYKVAILFIMMVPGIILKKSNMISDGFGKGLSNLVLYIAQPALVFLAYVRPYDKEIMLNSIYVLIFSVIAHTIFSVITLAVFKKAPESKARMLKFATIFANAAFMGIPLIKAVLEDPTSNVYYPGATMYASIYNITFNLFLWSLGVNICTGGRDVNNDGVDDYKEVSSLKGIENDDETVKNGSGSILKAILHPVTIAAALGLLFFILPMEQITLAPALKTVVDLSYESLSMLGDLVAPLSMLVIGIRLADMNFKGIFTDKLMYIFLALRHVALPLIMVGIINVIELVGIDIHPAVSMVTVILAATPAAASATMFAEKFNCDSVYASRLVIVSTIISIATMPLIMLLV